VILEKKSGICFSLNKKIIPFCLPPSPLLNAELSDVKEILPLIYDYSITQPILTFYEFLTFMDKGFKDPIEEICTALQKMGYPGQGQLMTFQFIHLPFSV